MPPDTSSKKSSLLPLIASAVILGVTVWLGWMQWQNLTEVKDTLAMTDTVLLELEQTASDTRQDYQDANSDFVDKASEHQEKIATVFPEQEDLTQLTRAFDDFAFKNHFNSNPFFISQLSYGDPVANEENTYRSLPITMTIESSERNFEKFLSYVKTSGSIESETQLMSIEAISLQWSDDDDVLRVQLSLNAYLQPSL